MLFSSLRELNCYKSLYAGKEINSNGVGKGKAPIPTILECQEILEMAWRTGKFCFCFVSFFELGFFLPSSLICSTNLGNMECCKITYKTY